eukprot:6005023-Pleurochrysis_carterae.AAC.1
MRDAARKKLENHYSSATCSFSRSFVVGPLNDVCCDAAGLAKGLAFGTYARARCDVRKSRAMRKGRRSARESQESKEAVAIEAWIRRLKDEMEGLKGKEKTDVWYTAKLPVRKRWHEYRDSCIRAKRPVIGSQSAFEKLWRKHKEIRQISAKKHAKCDTCGKLQVQMDSAKRLSDAHGRELQKDINQQKVRCIHDHACNALATDYSTI